MDLSIIIVNYKTPDLVCNCIKSIHDTIDNTILFEIIVVDNNSEDDSCRIIEEKYPQVNIIKNTENMGFGRANNIAILQSSGEYILLINSDVILCEKTIQSSLKKIKTDSKIGVLGCKLLNEDGSHQNSVYYQFADLKSLLRKNLLIDYFIAWKKNEISAIMGAYMLIPKTVLNQVGVFDPDFFMYSEEIELCTRIKRAGYDISYYDDVAAFHLHGASSRNNENSQKQRIISDALLVLKKNGVLMYTMYFILALINSITNWILMWFVNKQFRKDFIYEEKIFYSNFIYFIKIPFLFSSKTGNGERLLRRG